MINVGLNSISDIKIGTTQANKVYVGSTLVWEYNSGGLPSGFRELEYIASTKTGGQYIDLNILLYDVLNKNYDIAIKFNPIGTGMDSTTQGTIFGCQDITGSPWPGTFIRMSGSNMVGRYIGGSGKDNTLGKLGNDIELTEKTPPSKNVYNYNNGGLTHTWGTSLFCVFNNQAKTSQIRFIEAKLYYFKLFVEGTLVRDMIPCVNPNNVVGLYDLVNDVFYSSPNGAEFVAGEKEEQNLVALDYIEAANNGIIDLNYIPISGTEVTAQVSNLKTSALIPTTYSYSKIFGENYWGDNFYVNVETVTNEYIQFESRDFVGPNAGVNYYDYYTNDLDGLHTVKLDKDKFYIDNEEVERDSAKIGTPIKNLSLYKNKGVRYHSLTIKKANGTTITLKPYSNNGKAVLYDETNDVIYTPTGGDYICGSPIN